MCRAIVLVSALVYAGLGVLSADDLSALHRMEGRTIAGIQFDPPDQPLLAADLERANPLKAGTAFSVEGLRMAIKDLYRTGRYQNVEVTASEQSDGLVLIIHTPAQQFVGAYHIEGKLKTPPNRGQLAAATGLELGMPIQTDTVMGAAENMRRLLERNGFYESKVVPHLTDDTEHQQVEIQLLVTTGRRARYAPAVVTGDLKEPPEKVASWAKFKGWFRWKLVTEDNTDTALQRVRTKYNKQDRYMALVGLDSLKYDSSTRRATPTLDVDAGPKVKILTEGANVPKGKMRTYVPVYTEKTVNRDLLVQGARNLRDYFQSRGYFEVSVDFEQRNIDPDRTEVVYTIIRGSRHKVSAIEIEGNNYFRRDDLRERMFLQPAGFLYLRHGRYSDGLLRRDMDAIKDLYQSNGFRDIQVNTETVAPQNSGKTSDIRVIFRVEEGVQWTVSSVDVKGVERLPLNEIQSHLASLAGQPFSEVNVAMDRDYIIRTYQSRGYPDAGFSYRMAPDERNKRVALEYVVQEGDPRYVRDVLMSGLRTSRARLVDPNILLEPGDPLSLTVMGETQRRLYELGVFDKVEMAIQNPDGDTENKYVLYQIEEGPRYTIAAGFGAEIARIGGSQSSLNNAAGQTGFSPRVSLDVSRLNLWGLGHSLTMQTRLSSLEQRAVLTYSAPRYRNVDGRNILISGLYDEFRDVRTFSGKRLEGSAQISKKFTKATNGLIRYSYRRVSVDEGTLKIEPLLIPLLSQPVRIGAVAATLIHDRRDNPTDSHRGIYNTIDMELASKVFGSQRSFGRILARNSTYHRLRGDLVLARSLQVGFILPFSVRNGLSSTESIPFPERSFGGGSMSHRGFPDNQAGPRDPLTGFPLGGNTLLFHNTELRFPLINDNITGAVFHDMGNIYASPGHISFRVHQRNIQDFDYMVHAAGFGIRYRTPVGPIRVDLAYSINPPTFIGLKGTYQDLVLGRATRQIQGVSHFQFFFSIGQSF